MPDPAFPVGRPAFPTDQPYSPPSPPTAASSPAPAQMSDTERSNYDQEMRAGKLSPDEALYHSTNPAGRLGGKP